MKNKIKKISVIGDGGWGTTLAIHLSRKGYPVVLWGAFPEYTARVSRTRVSPKFLPDIRIPKEITITSDLQAAADHADLLVFAVPSQYAAAVINKLKACDCFRKIFVSVTKGFDARSLKRISEVVQETLGRNVTFAVLSGPTIARELALGLPTTAVAAGRSARAVQIVQEIFHSEVFRIYTSSDVAGVEIGGSVKNVIALACGVCDGLGFGTNAKAAIVTRGLAEMIRLGASYGAREKTFAGLSGLGDLITTCFNEGSRNRSVGQKLGEGQSLKKILSGMDMVAEGVESVKTVYCLAEKCDIEMPITEAVYNILYKNKSPAVVVKDLMSRKVKAE